MFVVRLLKYWAFYSVCSSVCSSSIQSEGSVVFLWEQLSSYVHCLSCVFDSIVKLQQTPSSQMALDAWDSQTGCSVCIVNSDVLCNNEKRMIQYI
jgi:hypothetical protein